MTNPQPLIAAIGGNSHAARSARARLQWRDRYGKFIEMGRGVKFKFRRSDGTTVSASGIFVGTTNDPNIGQLYVAKDPNGLKDGFYNISSANAQEILGTLDPAALKDAGITLGQHQDGTTIGDRLDTDIPNQDQIPYANAPTGWTATTNGPNITSWASDDKEFAVRPAAFPLRQKTGKQFTLFQNDRSVGAFTDWSGVLTKVNALDTQGDGNAVAQQNNQDQQGQADAKTTLLADPNTDSKTKALAIVKPYDPQGSIADLINRNGSAKDVKDALSKNAAWKSRQQNYTLRNTIDLPTKIDKQKWAAFEQDNATLDTLDTQTDVLAPNTNTGHNLDLSVGDVAATGYLVPTAGNEKTLPTDQFTADSLASYVIEHKDELSQGGKRLSITTDTATPNVLFDIADQVPDHNSAQQLASQRNLTEITDVSTNKVISTAQGRPREDGTNSVPDSNAQQPVSNESGASSPVADSNGGTDQAKATAGPNSPAPSAPQGGDPASSANPGASTPGSGDSTSPAADNGQGSSDPANTDSNPAPQPANSDNSQTSPANSARKEVAPVTTPAADNTPAPDTSTTPEPTRVPGIKPFNPADVKAPVLDGDGLPNTQLELEKVAARLEARAVNMQDGPAADSVNDQLDRIYSKIDKIGKENPADHQAAAPTPEASTPAATPAPAETPSAPAPNELRARVVKAEAKVPAPQKAPEAAKPADKPFAPTPEPTKNAETSPAPAKTDLTPTPKVAPKDAQASAPKVAPDSTAPKDAAGHEQAIKDAEARVAHAKVQIQQVESEYGTSNIPANSPFKPKHTKAQAAHAAARVDLANTRKASTDYHTSPAPVAPDTTPSTPEVPTAAPAQVQENPPTPSDPLSADLAVANEDLAAATRLAARARQRGREDQATQYDAEAKLAQQEIVDLQRIIDRRNRPAPSANVEVSPNQGVTNDRSNTDAGGQGAVPTGVGSDSGPGNGRADSGSSESGTALASTPRTEALAAQGVHVPEMFEVNSSSNAQKFHDAISQVKEGSKYGASVHVFPADNSAGTSEPNYAQMRLFMNSDGTAGFALNGSDVVSVFVQNGSKDKGGARGMLAQAVAQGGTHLDAFDTVLPAIYAKEGFVPVARTPWNDEYAPEGWNKADYAQYNGGSPDVVFMGHDPSAVDSTYQPGAGQQVSEYDQGVALATDFGNGNRQSAPAPVQDAVPAPEPVPTPPPVLTRIGPDDGTNSRFVDSHALQQGSVELSSNGRYSGTYLPDTSSATQASFDSRDSAENWLGDKIAAATGSEINPLTQSPLSQHDVKEYSGADLNSVPRHQTLLADALLQGKQVEPAFAQEIQSELANPDLNQGQYKSLLEGVNALPNRPGTRTRPRDAATNSATFTPNAALQLVNVDPGKIADPNLIMQDLKRNHPGYQQLANGDVSIESQSVNGKTYDLIVRRTRGEHFYPYIRETDDATGNQLVFQVDGTAHSYKALIKKINNGKAFIRQPNVDKAVQRKRKGKIDLPPEAQGDFTVVPDPVRDFIEHTDLARSGDEHTDQMAELLASVAARGESASVLNNLAENKNLSPEFVSRIVNGVQRKQANDALIAVQNQQVIQKSHVPFGGGDALKSGDWVDWTDYRPRLDLETPQERPNPNYGRVYRGQVRALRYKTNDGNGMYVYSDSTFVTFPTLNVESGLPRSRQRQRISSQLKKVESPNAAPSAPFFAKKEEKALPNEPIIRSFDIPERPLAGEALAPLKPRNPMAAPVEPQIDINGKQYLGTDENPVGVPASAGEMIAAWNAGKSQIRTPSEFVPGDLMMTYDGGPRTSIVTAVSPVEGKPTVSVTKAYYGPDGALIQKTVSMGVNERLVISRMPEQPTATPSVSGVRTPGDRVSVDDIPGKLGVVTDVSAPNAQGERSYTIKSDQTGQEHPRQERYINDVAPVEANGNAIQPASQQPTPDWEKTPAYSIQRTIITSLLDTKEVSPSSRKQILKALADDNFSRGRAAHYIQELLSHKDKKRSTPSKKSDGAQALVVAQGVASDLKRDPGAGVNGQDMQEAVRSASQRAALLDSTPTDRNYGGHTVKAITYDAIKAPAFSPEFVVFSENLLVGDLIPEGMGKDKRYYQLLSASRENTWLTRLITGPESSYAMYNGELQNYHVNLYAPIPAVLRPTDSAPKGYFKPFEPAIVPANAPTVTNDYRERADLIQRQVGDGYTKTTHIAQGAINEGAWYITTNDGTELFMKQVSPMARNREFHSEIVVSKMLNAIGLTDVVVTGLEDKRTIIQTKVSGDMAKRRTSLADKITSNPEKHPNFRLIGLIDFLATNEDRHPGNWFVDSKGEPVPIDHGFSRFDEYAWVSGPFAKGALGKLMNERGRGDAPMFTKAEMEMYKDKIGSLRDEFLASGNENGQAWYSFVMSRFDLLISRF